MVTEPVEVGGEGGAEARVEVAKHVGVLVAAYPHTQVTADTVAVYVRALLDVPPDLLEVAVRQCLAESEYFPTVARIRNTALGLASAAGRLPSPFEAWGQVADAIRRVGYYREPQFDSPLVARAVAAIGWHELCLSENQVADRAHFVKVYEQLVERGRQDARLLPEARVVVERVAAAQEARRLPAPRREERPVEAVPPTPEFMQALAGFAQTKAMPAEEVGH